MSELTIAQTALRPGEIRVMYALAPMESVIFNGRAHQQLVALERHGFVKVDWNFQSHVHGQGYRHTELNEASLTDKGRAWLQGNYTGPVSAYNDTERLDALQLLLTPNTPATEVFLAGLRSGGASATEFQCEIAPSDGQWRSFRGPTLRDAIDKGVSQYSKLPTASEEK